MLVDHDVEFVLGQAGLGVVPIRLLHLLDVRHGDLELRVVRQLMVREERDELPKLRLCGQQVGMAGFVIERIRVGILRLCREFAVFVGLQQDLKLQPGFGKSVLSESLHRGVVQIAIRSTMSRTSD